MVNPLQPWRDPGLLFRSASFVAVGLPVGIATFTVTVTLAALAVGLMAAFLIGVPVGWIALMVVRGFACAERSRASMLGPVISDSLRPLRETTWLRRLGERLRTKARWREVAHCIGMLPVGVVSFVVTTLAWSGPTALLLLPAYIRALPSDTAKFGAFDVVANSPGPWLAMAVGVVGFVFVAPWVTLGAAFGQLRMARALLGTTRDEELEQQVTTLETSRTAAVDSAEAERRRIERDLHDGAQQRLVALAANIGEARNKLDSDPVAGREAVAAAHEEAKAALGEIRDLIRGIHPVILEDRGIDAALSAVVARSPIPVALDVKIAKRPPGPIESAAYFVVSEALANVARHSQATKASVSIERAGDRLVIEIRDNGVGGADASRGTGLDGLRERVAGLGGSIWVISPDGGPTTISVELPCAS